MNKIFVKIIAIVLIMLTALICPLQAFAAFSTKTYISDLKISYGTNSENAKQWLENNGYTVIDYDLNEEADSALISARAVYLGYKTTKKESEAITDLKVMNMKGNYNFSAYQKLLEDYAAEIGDFIKELVVSLNEYRENYKNGKAKAKATYDILNLLYDDDTGMNMGELLLNKTVQEIPEEEFAELSDEEKCKHADMITVFMQGNTSSLLVIKQNLFISADTSDSSFIDRMIDYGCYDEFEDRFAEENNLKTGKAIEDALEVKYGDLAESFAAGYDNFKEFIEVYTESDLFGVTDENTISKWFDENGKDCDRMVWENARNLYFNLVDREFEDCSLYDFFFNSDYEFKGEDNYMFYPLAGSLSEGQKACAPYMSLVQIFSNGIISEDAWEDNYTKVKNTVLKDADVVSVYSGVNREVFGNDVALTNAAKKLNDSSTYSYMNSFFNDGISLPATISIYAFEALACLTGLSICVSKATNCELDIILSTNLREAESGIQIPQNIVENVTVNMNNVNNINNINNEIEISPEISNLDNSEGIISGTAENNVSTEISELESSIDSSFSNDETLAEAYIKCDGLASTSNILWWITCGLTVATLIAGICGIVYSAIDCYNYYHTEKDCIPEYICDEAETPEGKFEYVFYKAVTCNRFEKNFNNSNNEKMGVYGDLNGDIGKEWLALYVTKDTRKGRPISTEFIAKKGDNNLPSGKTALTLFGDTSPLNLVDEKYTYCDEFNGLYFFYTVSKPSAAASVITTGKFVIIAVASAAVSFGFSYLLTKKKNTKKEEA